MATFSEIVEKYTFKHHETVRKICRPVEKTFGINYVTYHTINMKGEYSALVSRPDWAEYYNDQQYYLEDPFLRSPECFDSCIVPWDLMMGPEVIDEAQRAWKQFELSHGMMFIQRKQDSVEMLGFSCPPNGTPLKDLAVRHSSHLKAFARYFLSETEKIRQEMTENPFQLKESRPDTFEPDELVDREAFYKEILSKDLSYLTDQEKRLMIALAEYYTVKNAADCLKISVRTAEHYLDSIKDKLLMNTKQEVISLAQELISIGYFLP